MAQTAYEAGTYIRYGGTGVCLIERIEEMTFPGGIPARLCYVLKPLRNRNMEISIPLDSEMASTRIQPIRTKEEIEKMLSDALEQDTLPWIEDRKQRNSEFRKILALGDAQSLLRMIRCIMKQRTVLRGNGRRLTAADDSARKEAVQMLEEEFGFSLGMSAKEASEYICNRLQVAAE